MQVTDIKKIIVALDFDALDETLALAKQLNPKQCRVKVGKELFTCCGPKIVEELHKLGFDVFLDLKFHDIPNTVAKAVKAAAELGVWMVNVHASGGFEMMKAARAILEPYGDSRPLLIAVTVLTSMSSEELAQIGYKNQAAEQVQHLAKLTKDAGLDGVVCSALEASALKENLGNDFLLITPGIRPKNSETGDQKRIMTPTKALEVGSDYLVIGRPITQAVSPLDVLAAIADEVA